jgi:hypothetical protein
MTEVSDDATEHPAQQPPPGPYYFAATPCQHVAESRRLIAAAGDTAHPGRAVVLGAGNCAEIPLAELAARFERVTLNDVDGELVEQGIVSAGLDAAARAKIDVQVADLTGVTQTLLDKFDAAHLAASDPEQAIDEMARLVDDQTVDAMPLAGKYDLVVASCVLSQLHNRLAHGSEERFARRFPDQVEQFKASPRWAAALSGMARRMEVRLIDGLIELLAPGGLIYLSESPQMCYIKLTADGRWETQGTYRMLRTADLTDYIDRRFAIIAHGRWHWVVSPPEKPGEVGRLFDVQALVLRVWRA